MCKGKSSNYKGNSNRGKRDRFRRKVKWMGRSTKVSLMSHSSSPFIKEDGRYNYVGQEDFDCVRVCDWTEGPNETYIQ